MAKPSPRINFNPRRHIFTLVSISVLVIVVGSLIAIAGLGPNSTNLRGKVFNFISRLSGSNLVVTVDKTTLPADGKSVANITVERIRISDDVTARLIQGSGTLQAGRTFDNKHGFIFTAGTTPGDNTLEFEAGSFTAPLTITLIDPNTPGTPVISSPPANMHTSDPTPEVAGTAPPTLKVQIMVDGSLNTTLRADDKGSFRGTLEKPLTNGSHTLTALALNDIGVTSPSSNSVTIEVQAEPVKVDANNIRTSPRHITVGIPFGVFIPASTNTTKIIVSFEGRDYELLSHNGTSVFSGTLESPSSPGNYSGNVTLIDQGGNPTKFDGLLHITVYAN